MAVNFNGIKLNNTTFNGIDLAKVLFDGVVVFLKALLYENGEKIVEWATNIYTSSGYSSSNASVSFEANQIVMFSKCDSNSGDCSIYTQDKINFEKYSKLCAEIYTSAGGATSSIDFGIISTLPTSLKKPVFQRVIGLQNYNTITKVEINVSDINDSYNVGFWNWNCHSGTTSTLVIKKVWLE